MIESAQSLWNGHIRTLAICVGIVIAILNLNPIKSDSLLTERPATGTQQYLAWLDVFPESLVRANQRETLSYRLLPYVEDLQ